MLFNFKKIYLDSNIQKLITCSFKKGLITTFISIQALGLINNNPIIKIKLPKMFAFWLTDFVTLNVQTVEYIKDAFHQCNEFIHCQLFLVIKNKNNLFFTSEQKT